MSFNTISKLSFFIIIFIFIYSCQDKLLFDKEVSDEEIVLYDTENKQKIDLSFIENSQNQVIDFYTEHAVDYDFLKLDLDKVKINGFENKYVNSVPINLIIQDLFIYSVNFKGEILKFDLKEGKLIDKYKINVPVQDKKPVSFSSIDNDFIVGFKSGEVLRINSEGNIIWQYNKINLLNTPIKHFENNLIVLYSDSLVIIAASTGEVIFEKVYKSNNIIQSSGGKITNYFNIIFFILPNSEFDIIDTFLYNEHLEDLKNVKILNSLNNLNDFVHIYKNLFIYLDNGKMINTYDLIENKYIIKNKNINNSTSQILYNNALISKGANSLKFYNLTNSKVFFKLDISEIFKEDSVILKAITINDKLHVFDSNGILLIINKNLTINKIIDLKIRNINRVYNHQGKLFISTNKGFTYIF